MVINRMPIKLVKAPLLIGILILLMMCRYSFGIENKFPDYYLIGAPKCATTSLHDSLSNHKQLCRAKMKEAHYFDNPYRFRQGDQFWCKRFFTDCNGKFLDSTPDYLHNFEAPLRMLQSFTSSEATKKKFIVILRDPVARAFSWYNHLMNHCVAHLRSFSTRMASQQVQMPVLGWNTTMLCNERQCRGLQCSEKARFMQPGEEVSALATFAQFVRSEHFPAHVGYYEEHLEHWLMYFERRQILILNYEFVVHNTSAALRSIERFLGLRPYFTSTATLPHENGAAVKTTVDCKTRDELRRMYSTSIRNTYALVGQNSDASPSEPPFGKFTEQLKCTP